MGQAVVPVEYAIDAAFQYFVTAAKLLRFFGIFCCDLIRRSFRLLFFMTGTRTNREFGCC